MKRVLSLLTATLLLPCLAWAAPGTLEAGNFAEHFFPGDGTTAINAGEGVATGDLDSDGLRDDAAIGVPGSSFVCVLFGTGNGQVPPAWPAGGTNVSVANECNSGSVSLNAVRIEPAVSPATTIASSAFGAGLEVGDVDCVGNVDLVIGDWQATSHTLNGIPIPNTGAVYILHDFAGVVSGSALAGTTVKLDSWPAGKLSVIHGTHSGDLLGCPAVAEIDGDGHPDLILGAPGYTHPVTGYPGAGRTYVVGSKDAVEVNLCFASGEGPAGDLVTPENIENGGSLPSGTACGSGGVCSCMATQCIDVEVDSALSGMGVHGSKSAGMT